MVTEEGGPFYVLFDTNSLIYAVQWKVSLEDVGELFNYPVVLATVPSVVKELETLAEGRGKTAVCAKVVLDRPLVVLPYYSKYADASLLLALSKMENSALVTNDDRLAKKAKALNRRVLKVRRGKGFEDF